MQYILASQSPRRRELLGLLGLPFVVRASDIDETMDPLAAPEVEVARVARCKALATQRMPEDVVIAADTIVVCDHQVLGKPHTQEEARAMLGLLSGRAHQVMTGVAVLKGEKECIFTEITDVYFRPLSDEEIRRYVASGEPMDKAGSYGIQGGAAIFCEKIAGDYYNVVGLPICRLGQVLKEISQ